MLVIQKPKGVKLIDEIMLAGGVIGPISAIPQILTIYVNQAAGQVSLYSWVLFTVLSSIGILYSIIHREKIILVGYVLYFLVDLSIVIGILIYS